MLFRLFVPHRTHSRITHPYQHVLAIGLVFAVLAFPQVSSRFCRLRICDRTYVFTFRVYTHMYIYIYMCVFTCVCTLYTLHSHIFCVSPCVFSIVVRSTSKFFRSWLWLTFWVHGEARCSHSAMPRNAASGTANTHAGWWEVSWPSNLAKGFWRREL